MHTPPVPAAATATPHGYQPTGTVFCTLRVAVSMIETEFASAWATYSVFASGDRANPAGAPGTGIAPL